MKFQNLIVATAICLLSACSLSGQEPAILSLDTHQDGLETIQKTIGEMLNGSNITLADNAFLDQSEVIIERRQNSATPVTQSLGRDYSRPDHFKLWLSKNDCMLEHVESGNTEVLDSVNCVANVTKD